MKPKRKKSERDVIETYIAIDMGTSGSGCAYCTKDTTSINGISLWTNWGENEIKYKNPSAILYKNQTAVCWGIKAINMYKRQRRLEKKQNNTEIYYLIQNFKLNIHTKEPIIIRGVKFDINTVVSDFLKLIRLDIEEELRKQNKIVTRKNVKYAITVPAIWTDADKALMRRAARYAGILTNEVDDKEHFLLALEPESAALPCLLYKSVVIEPFTRFLVFDAGGGTVDLSVYETTKGTTKYQFRIKQLKKASGGTCGGKSINDSFMEYLSKVMGDKIFAEMMKMPASSELEQNLEKFKIGYTMTACEDDDEFFIPIPNSIAKFLEKCNLDSEFFDLDEGEIVITGQVLTQIYSRTIEKAIKYISQIIVDVQPIKYIFMVGGFSDSNLLYNAIKQKFQTDVTTVVKPSQPGIRVLQGAIWFAKNPYIIVSRCSPLTYGVNVTDVYNNALHYKKDNIIVFNGKKYSQNLFKVMIRSNEVVETGTKVKIGVKAIKKDYATFEVFSSMNTNPVYVDDEGCEKLINITIPLSRLNQRFNVFMIFGETELKFEIMDAETNEKLIHTAIFEFTEKKRKKVKKKTIILPKKKRVKNQPRLPQPRVSMKEKRNKQQIIRIPSKKQREIPIQKKAPKKLWERETRKKNLFPKREMKRDKYPKRNVVKPNFGQQILPKRNKYPKRNVVKQPNFGQQISPKRNKYPKRNVVKQPNFGQQIVPKRDKYPKRNVVKQPNFGQQIVPKRDKYPKRNVVKQPNFGQQIVPKRDKYPKRNIVDKIVPKRNKRNIVPPPNVDKNFPKRNKRNFVPPSVDKINSKRNVRKIPPPLPSKGKIKRHVLKKSDVRKQNNYDENDEIGELIYYED